MSRVPHSFWTAVLAGFERHCAGHDYRLLLAMSGDDDTVLLQQTRILQEHRVDGFIIIGDCVSTVTRGWFSAAVDEETPIVVIDQWQEGANNVLTDDYSGAKAATAHIIDYGHRRIVHVSGSPDRSTAQERKSGYLDSLREHGIDVDYDLIVGDSWDSEVVRPGVEAVLTGSHQPTAVFAANDFLAAAVLQIALERGLRVPGDLTVVGYGNTEVGLSMGLTTVCQNPDTMGERAIQRLIALMDNPDMDCERILVPTSLVVRRSSGPPRV